MRDVKDIRARITEVEIKLNHIDQQITKELAKPFFDRADRVCLFLDTEKKTHLMILDTLKWVLYE